MEHAGGPCHHAFSTGDVCDCAAFVPDDYPCIELQMRLLYWCSLQWSLMAALAVRGMPIETVLSS
jgi:hypothetical protein